MNHDVIGNLEYRYARCLKPLNYLGNGLVKPQLVTKAEQAIKDSLQRELEARNATCWRAKLMDCEFKTHWILVQMLSPAKSCLFRKL